MEGYYPCFIYILISSYYHTHVVKHTMHIFQKLSKAWSLKDCKVRLDRITSSILHKVGYCWSLADLWPNKVLSQTLERQIPDTTNPRHNWYKTEQKLMISYSMLCLRFAMSRVWCVEWLSV